MTATEVTIPERYNASLLLDRNLESGRADKVAISTEDGNVSYRELFGRACRYGSALRALGVAQGSRIVLALDDHPDMPALFLGAIRAGIVPVPVNPFAHEDDFEFFARDSEAALFVLDPPCAARALPFVERALDRSRILCAAGEVDGLTSIAAVAQSEPGEIPAFDSHRDDVAFWLYSSGSTGRPKGVVHLQHDMLYTCETYAARVLGIHASDVVFSTTKLFHAYGLGNGLSFPYWAGASTVLLNGRATPGAVYATIARHRPTLFFSAPTLYNALLNAPEASKADLSSVRLCVSAAETLPAEVWQRWHDRFGLVILDGIGSTELLHIYCSNREDDCVPGSSGRPVPGYDLKLHDDEGREVVGAGVGDLYARGDSLFAEYWSRPELTAAVIQEGWFATRDRYRRDEDGRYWCEGRSDDMFKVSGLWVSPTEVEARLLEHPAVLECASVGVQVEGFVKSKAFVVLREGRDASDTLAEELQRFCRERLHRYEVPQLFEFLPDLPKTVTGKIQRFKLRAS
jgi:benzoate-CoA ligase family protein